MTMIDVVIPAVAIAEMLHRLVLDRYVDLRIDVVEAKFLLPSRYERTKLLLSLTGNHTNLASRYELLHLLLNLGGMSRENCWLL